MAENVPDNQLIQDKNLEKLNDQLIEFLSSLDIDSSSKLDDRVATILNGTFEKLNCSQTRKTLEDYLCKIDQSLVKLNSFRKELDESMISRYTTRNLMVCGAGGKRLKELVYIQEEMQVPVRELLSEMELEQLNELTLCYDKLMVVRELIVKCLRVHTELYLMAQDISELIENITLLNLDASKFPDLMLGNRQLDFYEMLNGGLETLPNEILIGGAIGGVAGLLIGGAIGCLGKRLILSLCSRFFTCYTCLHACKLAFSCLCGVGIGGVAFALITGLGIFAGWTWVGGTARREPLEELHKFLKRLEDSEIEAHLRTLVTELSTGRDAIKKKLSSESQLDLNLIINSYKEYRNAFEKARKKRPDLSDAEIHAKVQEFGTCIDRLMVKIKISEKEAWKLIDVIHDIATRK